MRDNRIAVKVGARPATWPQVYQGVHELIRLRGLRTPAEIAKMGTSSATLRLESNADAVSWIRWLDPRAAQMFDQSGLLRARCDWMGWELTIIGGLEQPEPTSGRLVPLRRGQDRGHPDPIRPTTPAA